MNTLLSRFMALFMILLIAKPSLVHLKPVQSDSDNTANASTTTLSANPPRQNLSLPRYTAMVDNLVGALQIIHSLLAQHGQLEPFEYCFVQSIANPPSSNVTVEQRLLIDYRVLTELTTPLQDVMNYERHNSNDSDIYQDLIWTREQVNTSLEQIQNIQNSDQLMEQLSHSGVPSERLANNSTSNNSTMSQGRCGDIITDSTDEFRDLFEIFLGLYFAVSDLLDIQHELDPHENNS